MPNPSFEEYNSCPMGPSAITNGDVMYWFDPIGSTSDYFHPCSGPTSWVYVPYNMLGYQQPKSGDAYAGLFAYYNDSILLVNFTFREYISCMLKKPLAVDHLYCFTMFVNLGDSCNYTIDNMGVVFSWDTLTSSNLFIAMSPDIVSNVGFIEDKINWTEVKGYYLAKGNERFMTIGNFQTNEEVNRKFVGNGGSLNNSTFISTYLYVDDVSLVECTDLSMPNIFTPNGDAKNDRFNLSFLPEQSHIKVYNRWGKLVFETDNAATVHWDGKNKEGELVSNGVYFYVLEVYNVKKTGTVQVLSQ